MKSEDFLGLMNILMQLRKVCNHPDLYEPRLIESPFFMVGLHYYFNSMCLMPKAHDIQVNGLRILMNQLEIQGFNLI